MRNAFKVCLGAILSIAVLAFFVGTAAALHVRSAIEDGALATNATCVSNGDLEKLDTEPSHQIEDYFLIRQIHHHYYSGTYTGPSLGWRGAFIWIGTRIGLSGNDRSLMTRSHFLKKPACRAGS
ncbi:MAG: hypothetical protein ABJP34_11505 [Erythrobacter sp.]